MASQDGAPALLLQQLSSEAANLVGDDDLVAAARSALHHQPRAAASPASSRDMLIELQREAVELASPGKELTAWQLHGDQSSGYDVLTAFTAALPSAADVQTMHREATLAHDEAENQAASEKHAATRATTLAADLAQSSETLRRRIVQASQAERWLSEQIKEKDAQLQSMRAEVARLSDVEHTMHELSVHGDGRTTAAEHSLSEMTALVEESIALGAEASVEEEREACRIAVRQEGTERGKRVMAEQMTVACNAASEDLKRQAADFEAWADQDHLQAERLTCAIEEITREAQRVREEAQAAVANIAEQAAQMVGAPTNHHIPKSADHSHARAHPTQAAWMAAGANEFSEDGLHEVALPHHAAASWAEDMIAPVLAKERSLALAAQRDAAEAKRLADLSVQNVCAVTQKLGATAIDLDRSVTGLVAQRRQLEASISTLKADQRIDAVLRSPAVMLHGRRQQEQPQQQPQQPQQQPQQQRRRRRQQRRRQQQASGQQLVAASSIDAVDRKIDALLAQVGHRQDLSGMQPLASGMGVALRF
jgi:hypothetical protein